MTNEEFKTALHGFKYYLKPALFVVLSENADAFSDETKNEILDKLREADSQMKELVDYQEKRNGIMRRGLERIQDIYAKAKARFEAAIAGEQQADAATADEYISNL